MPVQSRAGLSSDSSPASQTPDIHKNLPEACFTKQHQPTFSTSRPAFRTPWNGLEAGSGYLYTKYQLSIHHTGGLRNAYPTGIKHVQFTFGHISQSFTADCRYIWWGCAKKVNVSIFSSVIRVSFWVSKRPWKPETPPPSPSSYSPFHLSIPISIPHFSPLPPLSSSSSSPSNSSPSTLATSTLLDRATTGLSSSSPSPFHLLIRLVSA